MKKKFIWIIPVIIIILGAGVYFAFNQQRSSPPQAITNFEECAQASYPVGESYPRQCWTPDGRHFVEEIEQSIPPPSVPITISGEITCLPKIGRGAQTLECAMGLKGADGRYYGLKNFLKHDPEYKFSVSGLQVEVSGIFSLEEIKGPDGNKYDVVGVIDVTSIKEQLSTAPSPITGGGCLVTGCSGEICSDEEVISICIFRPEYVCYKEARCERQANSQCGFTETSELALCLSENRDKSR